MKHKLFSSINSASDLASKLIPIAMRAGEIIMEIYANDTFQIDLKSDQSPLTLADLSAHQYLASALNTLEKKYPVVSEEDECSFSYRNSHDCFWLIDPLDGTKEFLARNGEFTVNIALINQGRAVLGVVCAPALEVTYWGGQDMGAYRIVKNVSEIISVSSDQHDGICRVVASKSHLNSETQVFISQLGNVNLVQAGSSLKFCRVAEGVADIYPRLGPTCEWDTAAAQAILEGAGGCVVGMDGRTLSYGKPEVLNPSFIATRHIGLIPKP